MHGFDFVSHLPAGFICVRPLFRRPVECAVFLHFIIFAFDAPLDRFLPIFCNHLIPEFDNPDRVLGID
ncbi:hypothetical protein D3C74_380800 [compost metagenome]